MRRVQTIECLECDREIDCPIIHDEDGSWVDVPEECECGAALDYADDDDREDFHADI
jgi:hypothetical protein